MQAKGYLTRFGGTLSLAIFVLLAGCAQPPTEKVTALKDQLTECENMGASVFAATELQTVNQKMAELNSSMEAKKNALATAQADSLATDMAALKSACETNGKDMAQKALASANEQGSALKGLLTEENAKVLGAEAVAKYGQMCTEMEAKVTELQAGLEAGKVLDVYNGATPVANDLAAAVQSLNGELEQAKALAAEKAAKKAPAKKAKK